MESSNLPGGDKQLSRKNAKRKAKAIDEAGNESVQEKSGKVQKVLDLIKDLGLTKEEFYRLRKILSDRNHRAHTKAETEGYKKLAEDRDKDVKDMLRMFNYFEMEQKKFDEENKKRIAETKQMEANAEVLLEEIKKLRNTNQQLLQALQFQQESLPSRVWPQEWGPFGNSAPVVIHEPRDIFGEDIRNMTMGNHQQLLQAQQPQQGNSSRVSPQGDQLQTLQGPLVPQPQHPGLEGIFEEQQLDAMAPLPTPMTNLEVDDFEVLLSAFTNPQMNGTQNNYEASTSTAPTLGNQDNRVNQLVQMYQNLRNQISELTLLIRGNPNV